MQITILHNQSFADFALHHCGKIEALFDLAIANGKSITDDIKPGMLLDVPDSISKAVDIVDFYTLKKIVPACGFEGNKLPVKPTGIDYMIVGTDFIVAP